MGSHLTAVAALSAAA